MSSIYDQENIGTDDIDVNVPTQRELVLTQRGKILAAASACVALMFGGIEINEAASSPKCSGTQEVTVQPNDTLTTLARDHIDVTSGYVPFQSIDMKVLSSDGKLTENSTLYPGETVVMPTTCED
jgi:hypothetical protein